jgi:hypothetical protein
LFLVHSNSSYSFPMELKGKKSFLLKFLWAIPTNKRLLQYFNPKESESYVFALFHLQSKGVLIVSCVFSIHRIQNIMTFYVGISWKLYRSFIGFGSFFTRKTQEGKKIPRSKGGLRFRPSSVIHWLLQNIVTMTFYFYLTKHVSQTHNDTLTIMTFYSHIFITTFFKSCAQGDSKINEKISYLILEKLLLHIDTSATTHSISESPMFGVGN